MAPADDLEPIAYAMAMAQGAGPPVRAALRAALARALKASGKDRLAGLLGDTGRTASTRLQIMRAAQGRVPEGASQTPATLLGLSKEAPPRRGGYFVVRPLPPPARAPV